MTICSSTDFFVSPVFEGNSIDAVQINASSKNEQMEILDVSLWLNSSANWRTPYVPFDAPAVQSFDRPSEFHVVGGYHANIGYVWRRIQKVDLKEENDRWIELANVTIPSHLATTHMAACIKGERLYLLTGQLSYGCGVATRSAGYLDLLSKRWMDLPAVPEARYAPSAVISNNRVHLFGGAKPDRVTPALDYWILDLDHLARGWVRSPSMPQSGDHGNRALIGGWIYTFAFEHGHSPVQTAHTGKWDEKQQVRCPGKYLAQSSVLKIHTNPNGPNSSQWIRLPDLLHPVSHAGSIVLNDQLILLIGGIGPIGDQPVSHVQLFNTYRNQWRSLSPLPTPMKSPLLWMNGEQSTLYLQSCTYSSQCHNYQTQIIWSHPPRTDRCLFYSQLSCTTRQLQRTPFAKDRRTTESRWAHLFSHIYLLNMPKSVERLRRVWLELNRMDLTSITLFEAFRVKHIEKNPQLIQEHLIWPEKMKMWKNKNDTKSVRNYVLSHLSVKLIFMHLWTSSNHQASVSSEPLWIMEDDLRFVRSRDETLGTLERTLAFLRNHSEIEWDLLYLGYRNIEATHSYRISEKPPVHLWRASHVLSNTAFIVNNNRPTVERLNQCYFTRLDTVDGAISYCLKYQFIRAFLIEPKLVQAEGGFSWALNHSEDYGDSRKENILGNHTVPATFRVLTED